ncbi:MAG: EamA family transporter [Flavobacteriales bacterium]|nr:EamA family transporter [Flavobacteriales bacterium]
MSTLTFLLVLTSAVLHASWNFVAKKHAGNYSIIYLSFLLSSIVTGAMALPYLGEIELSTTTIAFLLTTGIIHAVYGFVLTFTYKNGDISTLYPIVRGTGIAGAVILSMVILREHLTSVAGAGVFLVICGIAILSYRRNREATSPKGIFLALICGGLIMSYTIIDKMLVENMHPIPVLAASQIISVFIFMPYVLTKRRAELRLTLKTLMKPVLLISVIATSSYLIILFVMQIADISRIVAVREASVIFGAFAGYVILKENFSRLRLIGVLMVLAGIILVKLSAGSRILLNIIRHRLYRMKNILPFFGISNLNVVFLVHEHNKLQSVYGIKPDSVIPKKWVILVQIGRFHILQIECINNLYFQFFNQFCCHDARCIRVRICLKYQSLFS